MNAFNEPIFVESQHKTQQQLISCELVLPASNCWIFPQYDIINIIWHIFLIALNSVSQNMICGLVPVRRKKSWSLEKTISTLSLYYRYYHGVCSVELKSIISPKALFTRNTRFSNAQHPFAVKLDKNRTSAFANSFIPMTSRDWDSLPATVFPATCNLQLFKTRIHRHLQILPSA